MQFKPLLKRSILGLFVVIYVNASAQLEFYRSDQFPVFENGELLQHPWAGGLNSTQLSTIDLNQDGLKDIFLFDRTAKKFHTFLRKPWPGPDAYEQTFDYADDFPPLRNWVLLRDFNCDGKEDLFTSTPGGIRVWKNTSSNGAVSFDLAHELLRTVYDWGPSELISNLYVANSDVPSIIDYDGDGDLDIHSFELNGTTIEYHENLQADNGDCDSMQFIVNDRCFARIAEDGTSPLVYINDDFIDSVHCDTNVIDGCSSMQLQEEEDLERSGGLHAGSSLCVFDADGNGYKDVLLGDISAEDMTMVYVEGMDDCPRGTELEEGFPQSDVPILMEIFNAAFYNDVDGDGINDLIVSPADNIETADKESVWYYKNSNANDNVDLSLVSRSFLQSEMIDMGTICRPQMVDLNSDGLLDLIVSNRGFYSEDGNYDHAVWRYDNIGSASFPVFDLVDTDFAQISQMSDYGGYPSPAFGDLDSDGDMDMVLGTGSGSYIYYENTPDSGGEAVFSIIHDPLTGSAGEEMDPGQHTTPQIFDLDQDGLLDIISGERNGNINFYKNVGTTTAPEFTLEVDSLSGITTDLDGNLVGYSSPYFFIYNGETQMITGTEHGTLFHYSNIEGNIYGDWTLENDTAFGIYNGIRSAPILLDMDGDMDMDILMGNQSGGLALYQGGEFISDLEEELRPQIGIHPNPAKSELFIDFTDSSSPILFNIYDLSGRAVHSGTVSSVDNRVNVSSFKNGMYLIELFGEQGRSTSRFVKE